MKCNQHSSILQTPCRQKELQQQQRCSRLERTCVFFCSRSATAAVTHTPAIQCVCRVRLWSSVNTLFGSYFPSSSSSSSSDWCSSSSASCPLLNSFPLLTYCFFSIFSVILSLLSSAPSVLLPPFWCLHPLVPCVLVCFVLFSSSVSLLSLCPFASNSSFPFCSYFFTVFIVWNWIYNQ